MLCAMRRPLPFSPHYTLFFHFLSFFFSKGEAKGWRHGISGCKVCVWWVSKRCPASSWWSPPLCTYYQKGQLRGSFFYMCTYRQPGGPIKMINTKGARASCNQTLCFCWFAWRDRQRGRILRTTLGLCNTNKFCFVSHPLTLFCSGGNISDSRQMRVESSRVDPVDNTWVPPTRAAVNVDICDGVASLFLLFGPASCGCSWKCVSVRSFCTALPGN